MKFHNGVVALGGYWYTCLSPWAIWPLSSYILWAFLISHLFLFTPFSVKFIRLTCEYEILKVSLKRCCIYIWVHSVQHRSSTCRTRSPEGEGGNGRNPTVCFQLPQAIKLARVGDNYISILRGREFQLQITMLSVSLL